VYESFTFTPQKGETEMKKETEKKRYAFRWNTDAEMFEPECETEDELKKRVLEYEDGHSNPNDTVELFELKSLGTFKAGLVEVENNE
jgi:hypothetical protein